MRAPLPHLLLACVLAAAAACGGGNDDDTTGSTTSLAPGPTTPIELPQEVDDCEDEPDPADYVDGEVPPAIRPCELPTELVVHELRTGVGRAAQPGDTVIADYIGIVADSGEIFDTSYLRGLPLDFPIGRGGVIAGWDEGLLGATPGSAYKLDIPPDKAYGDNPPPGDIQPGDALSFIVEVRAVVPSVTEADAPTDLDVPPSVGATEATFFDVTVGDGATVELGDTAIVHMLVVRGDNEVILINSWEADDPLQIVMAEGSTLPGLLQALPGAKVGTVRVISMPPEDAFGADGEPTLGLPGGVDVILVVEVVGVY